MKRDEIKIFVKQWIDGHEPDTFVRNEHGKIIYSAGYSSLNLQIFFEMLLADFIDEQNEVLPQANVIKSVCIDCKDEFEPIERCIACDNNKGFPM